MLALICTLLLQLDGSVSLELTGGSKILSGSLIGDLGLIKDTLFIVGSYGVVKQADIASDDPTQPALPAVPSHLLGLGLDWTPNDHWMASASFNFSPRATDKVTLNALTLSSSRQSAQLLLTGAYTSGD